MSTFRKTSTGTRLRPHNLLGIRVSKSKIHTIEYPTFLCVPLILIIQFTAVSGLLICFDLLSAYIVFAIRAYILA